MLREAVEREPEAGEKGQQAWWNRCLIVVTVDCLILLVSMLFVRSCVSYAKTSLASLCLPVVPVLERREGLQAE